MESREERAERCRRRDEFEKNRYHRELLTPVGLAAARFLHDPSDEAEARLRWAIYDAREPLMEAGVDELVPYEVYGVGPDESRVC